MALPKLETPTYTLELPSTGEKIKYRPFLVKEQKALMIAQESDDEKKNFETTSQLINSCTFNKVDAATSPVFDVEFIFLKLRAKSVGEKTSVRILCPDDDETYVQAEVNLDEIFVQTTKSHTNRVEITDNINLIMRYPLLRDMNGVTLGDTKQVFNLLKKCIFQVEHGENIIDRIDMGDNELDEFIDNFTTDQFERISTFFNTMPKLRHVINVTNPKTKVKSEVILEGLESFLE